MKSRLLLAPIAMIAALASAYAQEVPVGVLSAQSGSTAFSGVPMANGTHLAVDEANQKNYLGTAKVKLMAITRATRRRPSVWPTSAVRGCQRDDRITLGTDPGNYGRFQDSN